MKLFTKDGGPESRVWGLFLVEIKWLFSIVLLRFEDGTREAYHSHAFNAVSWVLSGRLVERHYFRHSVDVHTPSIWPIFTRRSTCHKVSSSGRTWVLSFRGPWSDTWEEIIDGEKRTLAHGRKVVS